MTDHVAYPLSRQQRLVLEVIVRYFQATSEPPSVCYVARRLKLHHSTVQEHLRAIHEKGWLVVPHPDGLRCPHLPPI